MNKKIRPFAGTDLSSAVPPSLAETQLAQDHNAGSRFELLTAFRSFPRKTRE